MYIQFLYIRARVWRYAAWSWYLLSEAVFYPVMVDSPHNVRPLASLSL